MSSRLKRTSTKRTYAKHSHAENVQFPMPVISQDDGVLVLHFESDYIQSQMVVAEPDFLALAYTRTMMAFEAFMPTPGRIALIGLGGGSIAKWCRRHHPKAKLTVVEINPHVIAVRDVFQIPPDDRSFRIVCEDGAKFVAKTTARFDVLLVDCFGSDHLPQDLCSHEFYRNCHRTLRASGLMVANICGKNHRSVISRIRKSFAGQVLLLSDDLGNTVVFACKGKALWSHNEDADSFRIRVKQFERKHRLGKALAPKT